MEDQQVEKNSSLPAYEVIDIPEQKSQSQLKDWLSANLPDFTGDITNASILIDSLIEGINFSCRELSLGGLKFQRPKFVLILSKTPLNLPIACFKTDKGRLIHVGRAFLEKHSQLDMQTTYPITRQDGETAFFIGLIPDFFRLAGVEEAHHTIFFQFKNDLSRGIDPLSTTVADYDAQEQEYKALKWQLRFAKSENMPQVTIAKLQERLIEAKKIRNLKKSSI